MSKQPKDSDELKHHRELYVSSCAAHGALNMPAGLHYTAGWNDSSEMLDAVAKVASDAENLVISQRDEIAALTAKLEAAEQDAARYRFWKDWWMNSEDEISQLPGAVLEHLRDTGLDASFDAAIASTKADQLSGK